MSEQILDLNELQELKEQFKLMELDHILLCRKDYISIFV